MKLAEKQDLLEEIEILETKLSYAKKALDSFESNIENNKFDTLEDAVSTIENKLYNKADQDCEGSHNCGSPTYTQEFLVGDISYIGTLTVEYNRHDKTYYYIDYTEFKYEEIKLA